MEKINWRRKLTSRKLWAAVIGFITALLIMFKFYQGDIEKVVAMVSAFSVLIGYMLSEGLSDSAPKTVEKEEKNE